MGPALTWRRGSRLACAIWRGRDQSRLSKVSKSRALGCSHAWSGRSWQEWESGCCSVAAGWGKHVRPIECRAGQCKRQMPLCADASCSMHYSKRQYSTHTALQAELTWKCHCWGAPRLGSSLQIMTCCPLRPQECGELRPQTNRLYRIDDS